MAKTVFITGATSHTGSRLVKKLCENGYHVKCLLHDKSHSSKLPESKIEIIQGSLENPREFAGRIGAADAIINVAHINFAPGIIELAKITKINRVIFLSSQRRFTKFPCVSARQVIESEALIEASQLDYTIMRSAMIYGGSNDNNMTKLIRFLRVSPVFPIFNNGKNLVQPVFVLDLISAIISALERDISYRKIYNIAGPESMTYKSFIHKTAKTVGKKIIFLRLPFALSLALLKFAEGFLKSPFTSEQLQRLAEDKTANITEAVRDLDFAPRSFEEGLKIKLRGEV